MKSRGDGRAAVGLSVRAALLAPPAVAGDCAAIGWGRLAAVEPAEAPGAGADADAGIVAGCLAHPLATRISSAVGTIRTLLIG